MSLYPSLEDMKVDQMTKAQMQFSNEVVASQETAMQQVTSDSLPYPLSPSNMNQVQLTQLYPALADYMGLELSEESIARNMPEYLPVALRPENAVAVSPGLGTEAQQMGMLAPLSGSQPGFQRAQITHGIRELILCKDGDGRVGLRVKAVNKGVFVCFVKRNSPAALAGLRFGDQILQVEGRSVAGDSMDEVHSLFKKSPSDGISVIVRDRPFERTVTLHKDSAGHIGFQFRDGAICGLVKDSSAARNGLLTDHHLLEVNGQNVVGLKDKDVTGIIQEGGQVITVAVMPSVIYKHIVRHMSSSLLHKAMDHSIPDL